jgi:hypothetical protein
MWLGTFNTTPSIKPPKYQEFVVSQSKLISVEDISMEKNET